MRNPPRVLDKHTMVKCLNCNTWRGNSFELQKHIDSKCRFLSQEEKEYCNINREDDYAINRRIPNNLGLPSKDTFFANSKIKYDAGKKLGQYGL